MQNFPVPAFKGRGLCVNAQGEGLIVNICSVSSYVDLPLSAAYCASKAALLSVTNVLRMEVEPLGLHVMGELNFLNSTYRYICCKELKKYSLAILKWL